MYPSPEHFIVRPGPPGRGETIVPLIAVDQLPDWVQLAGAPRQLDVEQAVGLINLGLVAGDGLRTYEVRLRADRIRAIMSGNALEEDEEEPLAPSDSVSEKGTEMQEEQVQDTTASGSREQTGKIETKDKQGQAQEETQKGIDLLKKAEKKAANVETAPLAHGARAWGDGSEVTSRNTVSTGSDNQNKPPEEQQDVKEGGQNKKQTSEPMLSASRHNTAADAAVHKPGRRDKPIRPHLMEEMLDTRAQRVDVPRVKDRLFGTNPDTIYCRHWCHHGTCKWGWECRYQHRMPTNQEGLREVGLKDFPTWYLLMMASGGFSGIEGNNGPRLHGGMNMNVNAMRSLNDPMAVTNTNNFLTHLGRDHGPADALFDASPHPQHNLLPRHPSAMELHLLQGRVSTLLAGSTAISNRQKLRQIKEMREVILRTNALEHNNAVGLLGLGTRYSYHHGRANLHTNASVAANAAGLSAASRRQALREAERTAVAPVDIPSRKGDEQGKRAGSYDELEARLSPVGSDGEGEIGDGNTAVREGKLVDIE